MSGSPIGMKEVTIFYEPGVRSAFPDGLVEAKREFADWLERRAVGDKTFKTADHRLIFQERESGSFSVHLAPS